MKYIFISLVILLFSIQDSFSCEIGTNKSLDLTKHLNNQSCLTHKAFKNIDRNIRLVELVANKTEYEFAGRIRSAYKIDNFSYVRPPINIIDFINTEINKQLPNGCSYARLKGTTWDVNDKGHAIFKSVIEHTKRACTTGTCLDGYTKVGFVKIPKFKKCTWKTDIAKSLVEASINTKPYVLEDSIGGQLDTKFETSVDFRTIKKPSGFGMDFLNFVTAGLAQFFANSEMNEAIASLNKTFKNIEFSNTSGHILVIPKVNEINNQIEFKYDSLDFVKSPLDSGLSLRVNHSSIESRPLTCTFLENIEVELKMIDQCQSGKIVHTVQAGETLWDITKSYYGNGMYYSTINDLDVSDYIYPGDEVDLIPFYEFENENHYTVIYGDSLWSIAKKIYGDGTKYIELANKNDISIDEELYPLQRIKLL